VAARTSAIKRDRLGGVAVDLIWIPSKLMIATKRWLQYMKALAADAGVDTASLFKLGTVEALPAAVARSESAGGFSPPGQMPLGVGVGAVTLRNRLHVSLRYRHAQFDRAAARRFAELYRSVLCG